MSLNGNNHEEPKIQITCPGAQVGWAVQPVEAEQSRILVPQLRLAGQNK